jgi:hypothetical protein
MMHSSVITSAPKGSISTAASADTAVHRAQLQGGSAAGRPSSTSLSGGAAVQQAAAASAAARAAAAGFALSALEDDDQAFDMYEDSGSTHANDDNPSDDMDADTAMQQDQQQRTGRHSSSADRVLQPTAGGLSSRAATAAATAVAGDNSAANRQAVALRVLSTVANRRKGEEVLTAHPGVAEAAGARSVRMRLLITEVSLYCDSAATSILAMEQSNRLMAKMTLPGE